MADSSQLGTRERIDEKAAKMIQAIPTSPATPKPAHGDSGTGRDPNSQEAERRVKEAERKLRAAERKLEEVVTKERDWSTQAAKGMENIRLDLGTQWVVEREEIEITGPELGRGSWATVSVAIFRGVRVAAKIIHGHIISHYNLYLFEREVGMSARIHHPNLVQFIGATQRGELIILTELMPTSLRRELSRDLMSPQQVTSIGVDVARALNYLHLMQPRPLIHRDINSANVLLQPLSDGHWKAKVSDYGTVNFLTEVMTICPGNPTYAAPEANDPTQQSPKMDIFSFGVLLIEMLTGEFPAVELRETQIHKIFYQPLLALIRRCLSQMKKNRPSASDVISLLETLPSLHFDPHAAYQEIHPSDDSPTKNNVIEDMAEEIQPRAEGRLNRAMTASTGSICSYSRGVEVLNELMVEVTNKSQSVHWEEYGLKLNIPENSLPPDIRCCTVTMQVSVSGQYKFPDNMELVSPVVWLTSVPHCTFLCSLNLEIQHCALPENSDCLSIARAPCAQDLPYTFELLPGATFNKHTSYGLIALDAFSGWGVLQKLFRRRHYWFDVFYIPFGTAWDIHFAITWDCRAHIKSVKDYYATKGAISGNLEQPLSFEQNSVTLDVPKEGNMKDGWKLLPAFPPTITKQAVDRHNGIQRCVLKANWTGGEEVKTNLLYRVNILGTTQETYFLIDINAGLSSHHHQAAGYHFAQPSQGPNSNNTKLSTYSVLRELVEITEEWRPLALTLGIPFHVTETIRIDNQDVRTRVEKVVEKWFQLQPNQISWSTLCTALRDPLVSRPDIAIEIKRKYPTT